MSILRTNQIQDTGTNVAANISGGVVTFPNKPIGASAVDIIANSTTAVSGSATQDIALSTDTNYLMQQIILYDVLSSSDADLYMFLRTTGGSFRNSSNDYKWNVMERVMGVAANGTGSNGDSKIRLNWYGVGTTDDERCIFTFNFYHVGDSARRTTIGWNGIGNASTGHPVVREGVAKVQTAESNDRIQLSMNAANIAFSGYVHYGYRRAL